MQNTSELIATLECRGEAVAAQFADGSVQDIPFDLIKRSQLLHAALCESNSEQDLRAGVPQLILQNWLQWRAIGTASDVVSPRDNSLRSAQRVTEQLSAATSDIPVETLVGYLQTSELWFWEAVEGLQYYLLITKLQAFLLTALRCRAYQISLHSSQPLKQAVDFLDDEAALQELCTLIAPRLIPTPASVRLTDPHIEQSSMEVLQQLHETLLIRVLSAALNTCTHLLSMLPSEMHMAILHAKYPNIAVDQGISVVGRDVGFSGWHNFWNLLEKLPEESQLQYIGVKATHDVGGLYAPLLNLNTVTKLRMECINVHRQPTNAPSWHLGEMKWLRRLELPSCSLGAERLCDFADQLGQLTALEHLDLQDNHLEADSARQLAPGLKLLTDLQHLDLWENSLECGGVKWLVPALRSMLKLTFLDLSRNAVRFLGHQAIMSVLGTLSVLESARIPGYLYNECIPSQFPSAPLLRHLDLQGEFHPGESIVEKLACHLADMTRLTFLSLYRMCLDGLDMEVLGPVIGCMSELQELNMKRNPLRREGLNTLCVNVTHLTALNRLALADTRMCDDGLRDLEQHLRELPQPLQYLSLSQNGHVTFAGLPALAALLSKHTTLTRLKLCKLFFDPLAVEESLIEPFSRLSCLQRLHLESSLTSEDAFRALMPCIGCLTDLEELFLGRNSIQEGVLQDVAPHLANLSGLKNLDLSRSKISLDDALALEIHLVHLIKLEHLRLYKCEVGGGAVECLLRLMDHNTAIQILDLAGAGIGYSLGAAVLDNIERASYGVCYTPPTSDITEPESLAAEGCVGDTANVNVGDEYVECVGESVEETVSQHVSDLNASIMASFDHGSIHRGRAAFS